MSVRNSQPNFTALILLSLGVESMLVEVLTITCRHKIRLRKRRSGLLVDPSFVSRVQLALSLADPGNNSRLNQALFFSPASQ